MTPVPAATPVLVFVLVALLLFLAAVFLVRIAGIFVGGDLARGGFLRLALMLAVFLYPPRPRRSDAATA